MQKKYIGVSFLIGILLEIFFILYLSVNYSEFSFYPYPFSNDSRNLVYVFEFGLTLLYTFLGIFFWKNQKETKNKIQIDFFRAIFVFFIINAIIQGLSVLNSLLEKLTPPISIFQNIPEVGTDGIIPVLILGLLLGILPLGRNIDKYLRKKPKPVMFILILIGIGASCVVFLRYVIVIPEIVVTIMMILGGVVILVFIFTISFKYMKIGLKSEGALHRMSINIAFGYIFTFFGILLYILRTLLVFPYNYIIFLLMNIIGVTLIVIGYSNKGE
jgi:hypothetical protein